MPKLVLIVDDDPAQRRILESTIKRLGYETKTAQSGEQALQLLEGPEQSAIALVLLDLVMPGLDGIEVLRRVAHNGGPPIIVQTANGSLDTAIGAMRAGAVDFVVKPTSPERLEVSIKSALKIEALQGELARLNKKANGTLTFSYLIIRGEAMRRVIALGHRVEHDHAGDWRSQPVNLCEKERKHAFFSRRLAGLRQRKLPSQERA